MLTIGNIWYIIVDMATLTIGNIWYIIVDMGLLLAISGTLL